MLLPAVVCAKPIGEATPAVGAVFVSGPRTVLIPRITLLVVIVPNETTPSEP